MYYSNVEIAKSVSTRRVVLCDDIRLYCVVDSSDYNHEQRAAMMLRQRKLYDQDDQPTIAQIISTFLVPEYFFSLSG